MKTLTITILQFENFNSGVSLHFQKYLLTMFEVGLIKEGITGNSALKLPGYFLDEICCKYM